MMTKGAGPRLQRVANRSSTKTNRSGSESDMGSTTARNDTTGIPFTAVTSILIKGRASYAQIIRAIREVLTERALSSSVDVMVGRMWLREKRLHPPLLRYFRGQFAGRTPSASLNFGDYCVYEAMRE